MRFPLQCPIGLNADDTKYAAEGRFRDASNMRWHNGRPQTIGGFESMVRTKLGGVCRTIFAWSDYPNAVENIAFGCHNGLKLYKSGLLYTITPTLAMPARNLPPNPLLTVDGSAVVTVAYQGHGLTTADSVIISGAVSVGRIVPNGTFAVTVLDENSYTFTFSSPADLAETLGSNPFAVVISTPTVTVTDTAHGIPDGTIVTFSGATAVGGITPAGAFAITVIDANSYRFTFTSNASSTASGGGNAVVATVPASGGGSAIVETPQKAFADGAIDGAGGAGFGAGGFGFGPYGLPSDADFFPRTWSFAPFGENLLANPRGGPIYIWTNDTSVRAQPLLNAPRQVTYMLMTPQQLIMAIGCNEEVSGVFNPLCIRHSSVRNSIEWNTATDTEAREYTNLPGGGKLVAGRNIGPYIYIWTTNALLMGTFVGSIGQPYRFDLVAEHCGLLGPNAAIVVGQTAFWISPDRQFYSCALMGQPTPIPCGIREDFAKYLTSAQNDKIVASSIAEFGEVRWDYPDSRDGRETSRYLLLKVGGPDVGAWSKGIMPRTAMVDAGPTKWPVGTSADGHLYWHERGHSADGAALASYLETADQVLSIEQSVMLNKLYPDIQNQQGALTLTITVRDDPQGVETVKGPYTISAGDRKTDVRATGRYNSCRFSQESTPGFWRLGTPVFEGEKAHRR